MSMNKGAIKYPSDCKVQNPEYLADVDQNRDGLALCTEDELNTQVTVVLGRCIRQYMNLHSVEAFDRMMASDHYTEFGAWTEAMGHAYTYAARYVQNLLRAYAFEAALRTVVPEHEDDEVAAPQP